jgi:hypothetical protein
MADLELAMKRPETLNVEAMQQQPDPVLVAAWMRWFEAVDHLDVTPPEPVSTYQQHLLDKYQQQGLAL